MKSFLRPVLPGMLLLLPVAPGLPQEESPQEPIPSPLIERQEVQFVTLDLLIEERTNGRWGNAHGVVEGDVVVLAGGTRVELDLFEDHCPEQPLFGPKIQSAGGLELPTAGELEPIRYVLYFDLYHLKMEGYSRAFAAALDWADRFVRPQDEVMVISGGLALRIVRPLRPVDDHLRADIERAMKDYGLTGGWAESESGPGGSRAGEIASREIEPLNIAPNLPDSVSAPSLPEGLSTEMARHLANSYASLDFSYARRSVENLEALMVLFDAVEGTKNLLLFQDTLRLTPGEQYEYADRLTDMHLYLKQLSRAANQRNVRIYPVVASGLEAGPGGLADSSMTMLASETGGHVVERTNDLGLAFSDVLDDVACFYRIGFRYPAQRDGRTQRIQVVVAGGFRHRVRYRQTFDDPTLEQQEVDRLRAAFLEPESAVDFPVTASVVRLLDEPPSSRVRLQMQVDARHLLALRADQGVREARLQLGGMVLPRIAGGDDVNSVMTDVDPSRLPWDFASGAVLRLPEEGQASGRQVVMVEEIFAPPGSYFLVAVVEDELARTVGATVVPFEVPEEVRALGDVHLASAAPSALFVEDDEDRGGKEEGSGRKVVAATASFPERVIIRQEASLGRYENGQLVYGVCDPAAAGADGSRFEGWALHRSLTCGGGSVPVSLDGRRLPVEGQDACFLLVEPLAAGTLDPGDCRYEVRLERPGSDPETRRFDFQVLPAE